MSDQKEYIVHFPNRHTISVGLYRSSIERHIDLLSLAVDAKKSFEEYREKPVSEIYSIFKALVRN